MKRFMEDATILLEHIVACVNTFNKTLVNCDYKNISMEELLTLTKFTMRSITEIIDDRILHMFNRVTLDNGKHCGYEHCSVSKLTANMYKINFVYDGKDYIIYFDIKHKLDSIIFDVKVSFGKAGSELCVDSLHSYMANIVHTLITTENNKEFIKELKRLYYWFNCCEEIDLNAVYVKYMCKFESVEELDKGLSKYFEMIRKNPNELYDRYSDYSLGKCSVNEFYPIFNFFDILLESFNKF